jgi:sulfide:quinone oxidoreductase
MKKQKLLILGGGSAGITVAARAMKERLFSEVTVIEPSSTHYYQPLWTLVGNGLCDKEITHKPMKEVMPKGVKWIQDKVTAINPDQNSVSTTQESITYDYLVVATGIIPDLDQVKGLRETYGKNGVYSVYDYESAGKVFQSIDSLESGKLLFTMPTGILKCAGAPQKIMWLSEDYLSRKGLRNSFSFHFYKEGDGIFGVTKYKNELQKLVESRDIKTHYHQKLVEVKGDQKIAVFEHTESGEREEINYDLLHVVPKFKTHAFISQSVLANNNGEVDVDRHNLQHVKYKNVFSLGDCSSLPTGKTGAAIRKQAPLLIQNLISEIKGTPLTASYNGYTACPILTRRNKVMLCEFDYDGNPDESFPFNQAIESRLMYFFKRYALPWIYWRLMLKGRA